MQDEAGSPVVGVETALPAFVGYTERAEIDGQPARLRPILIQSLADFRQHFGGPPLTEFDVMDGSPTWTLKPSGPIGLLYFSLCLFYENGGGACYVVSVGPYRNEIGASDLIAGLESLAGQVGPTMLVVPDLSCLPIASDGLRTVLTAMLEHCGKTKDRVALLDVVHPRDVDGGSPDDLRGAIEHFRADVGTEFLSYGMAYVPYLNATVVQAADIDLRRIHTNTRVDIPAPEKLRAAAAQKLNRLPASAAMAGVMTTTDNASGVWTAPANVGLNAVDSLAFSISDEILADLNTPLDGKSVNAIRDFHGRGPTVWGARTLDGNSLDYRYVPVRRTLIYIEQSIKVALNSYAFAVNDPTTWAAVVATVSTFLTDLWRSGGLKGAVAQDAFSVRCGLGSTMVAQDVLDGFMIVNVTVSPFRPAEFLELTLTQEMTPAT